MESNPFSDGFFIGLGQVAAYLLALFVVVIVIYLAWRYVRNRIKRNVRAVTEAPGKAVRAASGAVAAGAQATGAAATKVATSVKAGARTGVRAVTSLAGDGARTAGSALQSGASSARGALGSATKAISSVVSRLRWRRKTSDEE